MLKTILQLTLFISGLAFISCSGSSKQITSENKEQIAPTETVEKKMNRAEKFIAKFESKGVVLTEAQKKQIEEKVLVLDDAKIKSLSRNEKEAMSKKIKIDLIQNVLTAEQQALLQK